MPRTLNQLKWMCVCVHVCAFCVCVCVMTLESAILSNTHLKRVTMHLGIVSLSASLVPRKGMATRHMTITPDVALRVFTMATVVFSRARPYR